MSRNAAKAPTAAQRPGPAPGRGDVPGIARAMGLLPRDLPSAAAGAGAEDGASRPGLIFLRGEIDIANVADLRRLLDGAARRHRCLTLDLADTTFVDGAVIAALASAQARFPEGLRVRGASAFVAKVFSVMEMDHLLSKP